MARTDDTISYFCALFDRKMLPLAAGIQTPSNTSIIPLYHSGVGRSIYDIEKSIKKLYRWMELSLLQDRVLVVNDFKSVLRGFKFELPREQLNVYDAFIPMPKIQGTFEETSCIINNILSEMKHSRLRLWQKVAGNAAIVYESLERQGILVGGIRKFPQWTYRTVSGRSKNTGFNLQGTSANDSISDPYGSDSDYFVNFDWRAADIRIAAILSGDTHLDEMSAGADPYQQLSEMLQIPRKECKIMLLRAINSIDIDNPLFQMFPDLRTWMIAQKQKLDDRQPIASILGREFYNAEKPRSAFNATMQGSIAQAMQITIRRVWESYYRLLAETHDSITVACSKNNLRPTIREISNIMCRPFFGVLDSNPVFPVRVNVGTKWCQWEPKMLCLDVDKFCPC
jgi:hypothetical protein